MTVAMTDASNQWGVAPFYATLTRLVEAERLWRLSKADAPGSGCLSLDRDEISNDVLRYWLLHAAPAGNA